MVTDAYTTEDLVFHWRTDAKSVEMNPNISLPEYTITNVTHMVCSKNFSSTGQSVHRAPSLCRYIITSPSGTGAMYCDQCVCLSVGRSVHMSVCEHISETSCQNFTQFSVHVACGVGCGALRYVIYFQYFVNVTSFSHNGQTHRLHT